MELPQGLKDELWSYCRVNEITNIDEFKIKLLKSGFTIEKYGSAPAGFNIKPKEVIKEVEVEKIIEVEKIVEVIKEVEVEKEVYVTDDEANKALQLEIERLSTLNIDQVNTINDLLPKIDELAKGNKELLIKHEQELKELEEKYKAEGKKRDIYGGATFGSNLID